MKPGTSQSAALLLSAIALAGSSLASPPAAPATQALEVQVETSTARALQQASPDVESPHWAELSSPQQAVRMPSKAGIYGASKLYRAGHGYAIAMPLTVGGQTFQLLVNTGSSDTWIATAGFECVENPFIKVENATQASCAFGPLYNPAPGFERIPDRNFNLSYASGEYITGIPGYDTVTVAGIAVPSAHIHLVNKASWGGDSVTSGLIGLAYAALTSIYAGHDPTKDRFGDQIPYAPLFESMYTNASVPPVFSLALERARAPSSYGRIRGGKIAFGGLPPAVNYTAGFARSQIIIHQVIEHYPAGQNSYSEYTIIPNGFVFPGASQFSMAGVNSSSITASAAAAGNFAATDVPMVVDSGTLLMFVPRRIAETVNAAFSPPAKYNSTYGIFETLCTAVPPVFGIVIGGKTFYLNKEDMFAGRVERGSTKCATGITSSISAPNSKLAPVNVLGATFLKNVLAVYDVGAGEMRFASRTNS